MRTTPRVILVHAQPAHGQSRLCAERLAQAFLLAGAHAISTTATDAPSGAFDFGLVVGLDEVIVNDAAADSVVAALRELTNRCRTLAEIDYGALQKSRFNQQCNRIMMLGVRRLLGLKRRIGFQIKNVQRDADSATTVLPYGLLPAEREAARQHLVRSRVRSLPWACIDNGNYGRIGLLHALIGIDPRGLVYVPQPSDDPDDDKRLRGPQVARILETADFYVWKPAPPIFESENERFRQAAICGCVPIEVVDRPGAYESFPYLTVSPAELPAVVRRDRADELRRRFLSDYLSRPGLEESVHGLLHALRGAGPIPHARAA
jgi:hypothetical protein